MFLLGKKMKMTQVWKDDKIVPVTLISAEPNTVTIVRTNARDTYDAVQLKLGKARARSSARSRARQPFLSMWATSWMCPHSRKGIWSTFAAS